MECHRFVAGMMIVMMTATSGCITTEQPPAQVAADAIESPLAVTCKDGSPFGRDTSHKKLAASFGASNVFYQKADNVGSDIDPGTTLYPRADESVFIVWKDNKRRRRPKSIYAITSSRWLIGEKLRVGMSLQQVQALNGKPFRVDELEGGGKIKDWRGGALERFGDGCRLDVRFSPDTPDARPSQEKYEELGEVLSDDPRLPLFNPTVNRINVLYE